jgi:tetratricopeptide (TPR) repeat protein
MERQGVHAAVMVARGEPPGWAKGADLERLVAVSRENPWLASLVARLAAILDAVEQDPWRKEVWRAWLDKRSGAGRLDPFLNENSLRDRSAAELGWVGETLLAMGNGDAAIRMLDQAIELDPSLFFARFGRARAAQETGDLATAAFHYQVVIALRPDWASAHNNLAVVRRASGDRKGAIAAWRKAVALRPDDAIALSNLGGALAERGRGDEAILFCRRAVAVRPDLAEAHVNLGNVLVQARKLDEAVTAYDEAIELRPDLVQAHVNLGAAQKARGKIEAAITAWRQATEVAPDHAEVHCYLGNALVLAGRPAEAVPYLRRGHELGSKRPDWHHDSERWLREAEESARKDR